MERNPGAQLTTAFGLAWCSMGDGTDSLSEGCACVTIHCVHMVCVALFLIEVTVTVTTILHQQSLMILAVVCVAS